MPFAAALRTLLEDRDNEVVYEFRRGDSLEDVLNRHLMTVERTGGDDVFTSVLLLSPDGKRLTYGAAPSVPASYVRASDFIEVGPFAGSCGAAAYFGHPVYSVDIEKDAVWGNYRDLALQHGYKSCWSTPIRNSNDSIIGTFAVLHRTVGMPTREEIEAIELITRHVADAIMWARDGGNGSRLPSAKPSPLRLVSDNQELDEPADRLLALAEKLRSKAVDLDRHADQSLSPDDAQNLRMASEISRNLAAALISHVELIKFGKSRS